MHMAGVCRGGWGGQTSILAASEGRSSLAETLNHFFVHSEVESLETASSHPLAHSSHTLLVKERRVRHCGHWTLGKSPAWVRIYADCLDSIAPDRSDWVQTQRSGGDWKIPDSQSQQNGGGDRTLTCHHGGLSTNVGTSEKKYRPETFFFPRIHMKNSHGRPFVTFYHCSTENIRIFCPMCGFLNCTVPEKTPLHGVIATAQKVIALPSTHGWTLHYLLPQKKTKKTKKTSHSA